jgi:hypothetical protein
VIEHPAYTVEPCCLRETALLFDLLAQSKSLFALSNGHIGWRVNLDEGEAHRLPGSYLNGVYETRPLPYAEAGYSYPEASSPVEICRLSLELPTDRGRVRLPAHLLLLDGPRTAILLVLSEQAPVVSRSSLWQTTAPGSKTVSGRLQRDQPGTRARVSRRQGLKCEARGWHRPDVAPAGRLFLPSQLLPARYAHRPRRAARWCVVPTIRTRRQRTVGP